MNDFYLYRGRDALTLALFSAGLERNQKVGLQGFTCLAVPEAILSLGLKPIWIDIDKKHLSISLSSVKKIISKEKDIKVLIIQHTYGLVNKDLVSIKILCRERGITLIEDCCHLPYELNSKNLNYGNYGDFAFYSFENGKPIVLGKGGVLKVNNPHYYSKIKNLYKILKYPSIKKQLTILMMGIVMNYLYKPNLYWLLKGAYQKLILIGILPSNFENLNITIQEKSARTILKLGNLQKFFLKFALDNYRSKNSKREKAKKILLENKLSQKICFSKNSIGLNKIMRVPFYVNNKNKILLKSSKLQLELSGFFNSPIHPLKEKDWNKVYYQKGSCPNAEIAGKEIVTISLLNGLTYKKIKLYINLFEKFKLKI